MGSPEVATGDRAQLRPVRLYAGMAVLSAVYASADNQISRGLAT